MATKDIFLELNNLYRFFQKSSKYDMKAFSVSKMKLQDCFLQFTLE